MDKIKNIDDLGNASILVMKKITEYAKPKLPKLRLFILPTLKTVLMKSFVLGVIIYGTHEAKVWGTPNDAADLWIKIFKSNSPNLYQKKNILRE